MIRSKNRFPLKFWILTAHLTVSVPDHLPGGCSWVRLYTFPSHNRNSCLLQGLEIVVCKLAFTLALNWSLLKMDSDLPWGLSLNPDPQNKTFQTTTEQAVLSPAEPSKANLMFPPMSFAVMFWLEIILKEVFAILPRILFLWKTITKQLNNQRKQNEELNTIIILNSTTRNILHFNSTNCSHFSTDLIILAISCGTIHKLINKYWASTIG